IPFFLIIALLAKNVIIYSAVSYYGPNQIALLVAGGPAAAVGLFYKVPFGVMIKGIENAIGSALAAILILLMIGALAGTWMISGVVPAMIYHGLDILNPQIFLVAAAVISAIVSIATGSSWSTVATVGIALLGIGTALDVSIPLTAGAIISGAYFGDKISPLSDTTNLAAAMAETNLITHIKYMLWTTVPSFLIACGIYLVIGMNIESSGSVSDTQALKAVMVDQFDTLSPVLFLVPLAVLVMVVMKVDALAALFVGTLLGALFAVIFQPAMVTRISGLEETDSYATRSYVATVNAMAFESVQAISDDDVKVWSSELAELKLDAAREQTGNEELTWEQFVESKQRLEKTFPKLEANIAAAKLLKGKGMQGMLNTIWLIVTAMCFGGIMEGTGLLKRITEPLISLANSNGSLVATTAGTCLFVNATASDQYLSIVVPGRMYREAYEDRDLAPENLSRTLEDSGTVTSVLIPWNTCGAAQSTVLSVDTILYAPFCFFNWISPLMTIFFGFTGIGVRRRQLSDQAQVVDSEK
ncbi:MAG: Na+/H+ antiporter NhaC family protein, partial [Planctomycetota bacterium]